MKIRLDSNPVSPNYGSFVDDCGSPAGQDCGTCDTCLSETRIGG